MTAPGNPVPDRRAVSLAEQREDRAPNADGLSHFRRDGRMKALGPPGLEEPSYMATAGEILALRSERVATPRGEASRGLGETPEVDATPMMPFRWKPVQRRQHGFIEGKYFMGTYVNSLSLNMQISGADWQDLELAPQNFRARAAPRCCLLGGSLVLLSGTVRGACPQDHDPQEASNAYIARLPEGMRPKKAMQFAALAQDASGKARRQVLEPQLVVLVVTPDGWIQGVSGRTTWSTLDLSAIRFSLSIGMAIEDDVRMHTCEHAGGRIVLLQGLLGERKFSTHGCVSLTSLPKACQPAQELSFIVVGRRAGSFQLMTVKPTRAVGAGAEIIWNDGTLDYDMINLSGVIYEAAPQALAFSIEKADWTSNRKKIAITDFQKLVRRRYGSFEVAWPEAFDRDGVGSINVTQFRAGCNAVYFSGDVLRLWSMLDEDGSGEITMDELAMDPGELETTVHPIAIG